MRGQTWIPGSPTHSIKVLSAIPSRYNVLSTHSKPLPLLPLLPHHHPWHVVVVVVVG